MKSALLEPTSSNKQRLSSDRHLVLVLRSAVVKEDVDLVKLMLLFSLTKPVKLRSDDGVVIGRPTIEPEVE